MKRSIPLLLSLLAPAFASAQAVDVAEHVHGVSATSALSGNGGLTAGLSGRGELVTLSWPSPSFHDQVDHHTAAGEDARSLPRFGAPEDRGVFAGLLIQPDVGDAYVTWLRDAEWEHVQDYRTDGSPALVQGARLPGTGLSVFETTFVDASADVLHRRATLQRDATSDVRSVRYLLYSNLAPQLDRPDDVSALPAWPGPEADDDGHDFAAFWSPDDGAFLHFSPAERDHSLLDALMTGDHGTDWDASAALELAHGIDDGVFVAITSAQTPDALQVGWDPSRPCEGGLGWTWQPGSAWDDAADGALSGSPLGACHADAVLAWDLDFGETGSLAVQSLDQAVVVADSAASALALADGAQGGFDRSLEASEATWQAWLDGLALPSNLGEDLEAFAKRTLVSLAEGTDGSTGGVVSSVGRQPASHFVTPKDSLLLGLALDIAGAFDAAGEHGRLLASVNNQRAITDDAGALLVPEGAWLGSYWSDGQDATLANGVSMDRVGLTLWSLTAHAGFAPNDTVRRSALASAWPAMQRGADLLAACVADEHPGLEGLVAADGEPAWYPLLQELRAGNVPDEAARLAALSAGDYDALLPCLSSEDDGADLSVSLYAVHTARLGLLAAVDAARMLCIDDERVAYWEARAHELAAVALGLYYDEASGAWDGRGDWLLWPTPLWIDDAHADLFGGPDAADDLVEQALLDYASAAHDAVDDAVELQTEGGATQVRDLLALAAFWTGDRRPDADLWVENLEHLERLAVDFAAPGTHHLGAVFVSLDTDGDGTADAAEQRVSTPHLPTAAAAYLGAMALASPERFTDLAHGALDPICPVGEEPVLSRRPPDCDCTPSGSSGGCAVSPGGGGLLLLLLGALRRRR